MNDETRGIFTALFRAEILLHITATTAAHEDNVSAAVLTECATAADAVNRAIARHMVDHQLEPSQLQPLLDAVQEDLLRPTTEGEDT